MQSRRASDRLRQAADSHAPAFDFATTRARRLRARLAGFIRSRYHMIRWIDAHFALKKLRELVPEVNAPELHQSLALKQVSCLRHMNAARGMVPMAWYE